MKEQNIYQRGIVLWVLFCGLIMGCRNEVGIIPPEITQVMVPGSYGKGAGFYVLNEGNMGSNHSTLDYFNPEDGTYSLNIYGSVNPSTTLGLGDVGNDLQVYGGKLYVAVNGSDKIEVLEKYSAVKLCQISVSNCRKLAFWKGKVLITSYDGYVGVVDTLKLQNGAGVVPLDASVKAGREPEGLAVYGDLLYVANSGGYSPPLYDDRLSVINLTSLKLIKNIRLSANLNDVQTDQYGHLIVSARGDYDKVAPSFFILNAADGTIVKHVEEPIGNFTVKDSLLYYFTSPYDYGGEEQKIKYVRYNLKTLKEDNSPFLLSSVAAQLKSPFALAVDPLSDKLLISDAGDHISPGNLYWIDARGAILWKVQAGEIPGHITFIQ